MFLNYTNHSSSNWDEKQLMAAKEWGEVIDLHFPFVSPYLEPGEVEELASREVERIMAYEPDAVLCQGEFTLAFSIIKKLQKKGKLVLSACSERNVKEILLPDSKVKKEIIFEFMRFREYCK